MGETSSWYFFHLFPLSFVSFQGCNFHHLEMKRFTSLWNNFSMALGFQLLVFWGFQSKEQKLRTWSMRSCNKKGMTMKLDEFGVFFLKKKESEPLWSSLFFRKKKLIFDSFRWLDLCADLEFTGPWCPGVLGNFVQGWGKFTFQPQKNRQCHHEVPKPETNVCSKPEEMAFLKKRMVLQPSIFRCEVLVSGCPRLYFGWGKMVFKWQQTNHQGGCYIKRC